MGRVVRMVVAAALATAVGSVALPAPAAVKVPRPKADYRFEGSLKSSAGKQTRLVKEGPGVKLVRKAVLGNRERVLSWPEGSGVRLNKAGRVLGSNTGTYTFVMLIKLKKVDDYRKLIHFKDLLEDNGFYVDDGTLYAYPTDYSAEVVRAGRWYQIALTRDAAGMVKAYVDGKRVLVVDDVDGDQVLGPDGFLRFVRDDEDTETEESGGLMARLRIFSKPLTGKQIRKLGL